jgi:hypothetical protein
MSFRCWYTLPTRLVVVAGRVSKSAVATTTFWLALWKCGVWCTFMIDGDDDGSCSSLGFGVVDGGSSLCSQHGLASVKLDHLGVEGCLLTDKLIVALSCPPLNVDILGTGLHLLLLLVSMLLLGGRGGSSIPGWGTTICTVTIGTV